MVLSRITAICAVIIAAGCSVDSPPAAPVPPANGAPVFTSATQTSIAEDTNGVIYTAAANDPDGNAVSFSLVGGADASLFTITSAGALSFNAPPDFETPRDAGLDNAYNLTIRANDTTSSADLAVRITVTDGPERFRVRRVAAGLAAPLFLTSRGPGTTDVFVTERNGVIRILDPGAGVVSATPFLNISTSVGTVGEGGFLGMALAPDYAASGVFYVHLTNLSGDTEIRRYLRSTVNPNVADAGSGDVILSVGQPASNHNGGWIGFGADGFLYIALGDGGGGGDPFNNGQNTNTLLGAMLRIDPSTDAFPADNARDYAIPAGNPFASGGGAPEIWVFGLRNPFRASFDRNTGNLFIGDVGQGAIEEVDLVPTGAAGLNFGWPIREGTQSFAGPNAANLTPPIAEYGHGSGPRQGNSITGGYVYRGPIAALQGIYFFADFISGNIWSVPVAAITQGSTAASTGFTLQTVPMTPDVGSLSSISSFGEDDAGNLYIVTIGGGIFLIEAAP